MKTSQATRSGILDSVANLAVIVCAFFAIAVFIRREFFLPRPAASRGDHIQITSQLKEWRNVQQAGTRMGSEAAPIQIVELADFECPGCARVSEEMHEVKKRYGDSIAVTFVHFPLSYHRFALPAARAAECAGQQGRFAEMHDLLFSQQDSLGLKPFATFARDAGIRDSARFASCNSQTDILPAIRAGLAAGEAIKVKGTPTVIINGWRLGTASSSMGLQKAIERILQGEQP